MVTVSLHGLSHELIVIRTASNHGLKGDKSQMNAYLNGMRNYANFSTRSSRSEYWLFAIIVAIASIMLAFLDGILGTVVGDADHIGIISGLFQLAHVIPNLAVAVRRLHDVDRSGWWVLILILPLISALTKSLPPDSV
jgi:uncharacterized membrane protein YhaH (DUF805 family)